MCPTAYLPSDPVNLSFCADLSQQFFGSAPDAVWQVKLQDNGPITLNTSFGLRAQSFQIFPVFMANRVGFRKISEFFSPPQIRNLLPNHLQLGLSPSPVCSATFDIWLPAQDRLDGRISVKNTDNVAHELGARLAAELIGFDPRNGMTLTRRKIHTYLKGESDGLQISVIVDGMHKPTISPELALENTKLLSPGETLNIFWRCKVSEGTKPEDDRVFSIFPVNWDAEIARQELAQQTREINITTPNLDWDIALRMAQHQAQHHLSRADADNDSLTLIATRNPHSQRLTPLLKAPIAKKNRISALSVWQMVHALLPARVDDCVRLFKSYLNALPKPGETQDAELAFPVLCKTAWIIHSYLDHKEFLEELYPALRTSLFAWFWRQNDADQDGLPEWSSFEQTALSDSPIFNLLESQRLITPISTVETLSLAALLMKECQSLNLMARVINDQQTQKVLTTLIKKLEIRMQEFRQNGLLTRDRDSHRAHSSELYFEGNLDSLPKGALKIEPASRLNIKIKPSFQSRKPPGLGLQGADAEGHVVNEAMQSEAIQWLPGIFLYTSKAIFSQLDDITGTLEPDTQISIYRADLKQAEIGHLLAWDPNLDFPALQEIVDAWLLAEDAEQTFGLPEQVPVPKPSPISGTANIAWNGLLIQHLLALGEQDMAFQLFERLLNGAIIMLKQEHALHESFSVANGQAFGKANHITGVFPVTLFLDILGIKIYSPTKVSVGGVNPVPWPVTVRYMGLEITRDQKNSTITMPDGTMHHHFGSAHKTFTMQDTE